MAFLTNKSWRFWFKATLVLAGLFILSCNLIEEDGHTFIHVETDSTWVKYETIEITWVDSISGSHGILYQGPPKGIDSLNKLPADGYQGQKIDIIIKGYYGKELVHQEVRHFDGKNASLIVIDTVKLKPILIGNDSLKTNPVVIVPKTDTLEKNPRRLPNIPKVTLINVDTVISIRDSVSFSANAQVDSGTLKAFAWNYEGLTPFEGDIAVSGKSILIKGGHRYQKPGLYQVSLRAVSDSDSVATAHMTVQVLQDLPISDAGRDTTIYIGDSLVLRGKARDGLGQIIKSEWKIGTGEFAENKGEILFPLSGAVGDYACIFRIADDDSQSVSDTLSVHVVTKGESILTGIFFSKGILSPQFHPGILAYTDSLAYADSVFTVVATGLGVITVNGKTVGSGQASLPIKVGVGRDSVKITVANGSLPAKIYAIAIFRMPPLTELDNPSLVGLELSAGKIQSDFTPDGMSYALNVVNSVTYTWVTATLASSKSTLTIDNHPALSGKPDSIPLPVGIKFINIIVTGPKGEKKSYTVAVTRAPNANAFLRSLVVSSSKGDLDMDFKPGAFNPSLSVDHTVDSIWITPTDSFPTSTIAINQLPVASGNRFGPIPIVVGATVFEIVVTAQSSATLKYTVTVNRGKSGNANLVSLELEAILFDSAFTPSVTVYRASVENSKTSVTLKAKAADTLATLAFLPSATLSLDTGVNTISVLVTAINGTQKTYTVQINRAKNGNPDLSGLSLTGGVLIPKFQDTVNFYSMSVANEISSTSITATTASSSSKLTIGTTAIASGVASAGLPLKVGTDTLVISVTAENGNLKKYSVAVTRLLSQDAGIKELVLMTLGKDSVSMPMVPVLVNGQMSYTHTTTNFPHSYRIRPTANHEKASIRVNGFEVTSGNETGIFAFKPGQTSTLSIEVTSEDKTKKTSSTLTILSQNSIPGDTLLSTSGTFTVPPWVFSLRVMVVGGGGGGGSNPRYPPANCDGFICIDLKPPTGSGGGGGQGGVRLKRIAVEPGQVFTTQIGAAGIPGTASSKNGVNGGPGGKTAFDTVVALGGGGGGGPIQTVSTIHYSGFAGIAGAVDVDAPFVAADTGTYFGNGGKGGGRFVRHFRNDADNYPLIGLGGIPGLYGWESTDPPVTNTSGGIGGLGCGGGGAGSGSFSKAGGAGGAGFIYIYWGD